MRWTDENTNQDVSTVRFRATRGVLVRAVTQKEHEEARRMCEMVVHDSSDYVWMAKVLATAYLDVRNVVGETVVQAALAVRQQEPIVITPDPIIGFGEDGDPFVVLPRGYDPMRVVAIPERKGEI